MGASQYKKKRIEERQSGQPAREQAQAAQKKEQRKKRALYTVIGVVAVLFLALILLVNSPLFSTAFTAVRIGETEYSLAQVRYGYQSSYTQFSKEYGDSMSYFIDTSKDLDEQTSLFDSTKTWKDYFMEQGLTFLQEMTVLYDMAVKEGYELSQEERTLIDEQIAMLETYASYLGYTKDGYLALNYGEGNDEESVRDLLTRTQLAYNYAADKQLSFTYSEDELDEYYQENIDNYATATYLSAYFTFSVYEGDERTEEEAMADARASAEALAAACDGTEESFRTAVLMQTGEEALEQTSYLVSLGDNKDWFKDESRQSGDVHVGESSTGVTVYCYLSQEDNLYPSANVRHILIKAVDEDADGSYSDEEKAAALETLKAIEAEWDGSEEDFIRLAQERSEDGGSNTNGGLYENILKSEMVEEFNDFCFGDRESGDTGIVYGENSGYAGYHLIYYVGDGPLASRIQAQNTMQSEDYYEWLQQQLEAYPLTKTFMFRYA